MTFTKLDAFSKKPADLPDVPSPTLTPADIKSYFETPSDELKTTLNNMIDILNAVLSGNSGADNIGATGFDGSGSNIQALLNYLKANKTDLTGDHKGTWQGFTPSKADPGISSVVDQHTAQLAEKANHTDLNIANANISDLQTNKADKTDINVLATGKANIADMQTADANLQSQINTIVLNGTSGDSTGEVSQARVDTKGSSFATIKGHFDNVESMIKDGKTIIAFNDWVQGGLGTDGTDSVATTRIRTSGYHTFADGTITVTIPTGFKFAYCGYDANQVFQVNSGWLTGTVQLLNKYAKFRFSLAHSDDSSISTNESNNLILSIPYKNKDVLSLLGIQDLKNSYDWSIAGLDINGLWTASTSRIRTDSIQYANQDLTVKLKNGVSVYLWYYSDNKGTSPIGNGWLTSNFIIPKGKYYRILARNTPEVALSAVSDVLSNITIIFDGRISYNSEVEIAKNVIYDMGYIFDGVWELGSLTTDTGVDMDGTNRIRTVNYTSFPVGKTLKVLISSGYKMAYCAYDANKNIIKNSGWITNSFPLFLAYPYYRFIIANTSDGIATTDFAKQVTFTLDARKPNTDNLIVKSVAHRGLSDYAPESTLPAFKLAKKAGFQYVETDLHLTSDGVAVLLHDETIDRVSNGSGDIASLTLSQVLTYDFGVKFSSDYAGTKICQLTEFLDLCRKLGLHAYMEIKSTATFTASQVANLVSITKSYGMLRHVTWESFSNVYLGYVKAVDPKARLCYNVDPITTDAINAALALKTTDNEVIMSANLSTLTNDNVTLCMNNDLPLEVWNVTTQDQIKSLNPYITGVLSNSFKVGDILFDANV